MATGRVPPRDVAILVAVAALWGANFVPIRWALDEVPPFALASIRFLLAAIPAVFLVRRPSAPWWIVVAYGLAIGVGQFGLLFLAMSLGFPAGLASLAMQVQVFFTIALASFALGDRVGARQVGGAIVAALGLGVLAIASARGAAIPVFGLLLILGAAFSWAIGNVVAKHSARRHATDAFSLVIWASLVPPIPLALVSLAAEGTGPWLALGSVSLLAWASILFMAYGATIWGFATWNRMLHKHSAAVAAPFALLIPIAGLATTAIALREPWGAPQAIASALVLAGLAIAVVPRLNRSRAAAPT